MKHNSPSFEENSARRKGQRIGESQNKKSPSNDIFDCNEDHEEGAHDQSIIRNSFNDSQRVNLIQPAAVTLGIEKQAHSFATHNDEITVTKQARQKLTKKKEKSADFEFLHNQQDPSPNNNYLDKDNHQTHKRTKQPPKSQQLGSDSMIGQNAYENYQMSELRMSTGTRPPILQYTNTQSQTVKQDGGAQGGIGEINKKSFPYDEEEEEERNIDNIGINQDKWAPTMPYYQRNHQNHQYEHEHSPDYHEDHRHQHRHHRSQSQSSNGSSYKHNVTSDLQDMSAAAASYERRPLSIAPGELIENINKRSESSNRKYRAFKNFLKQHTKTAKSGAFGVPIISTSGKFGANNGPHSMKGATQSIFSSNTMKGIFKQGDQMGEVDISLTPKGRDNGNGDFQKTDPNQLQTDNVNHSNILDGTANYQVTGHGGHMNNPMMMNPHDKNLDFTESEADDDYDDRYITLIAAHSEVNKAWGVLQPDHNYKAVWDMICLFAILYQSIFVPYRLCFNEDASGGFSVFETIIDVLFILDILICFNIGFYKKGYLVMTRKDIALNYLQTWFFIDLVASFPYSWFFALGELIAERGGIEPGRDYSKAPQLLRIIRIVRFLRFMRLLRVFKLRKLVYQLEEYILSDAVSALLSFLKVIVVILLIAHWIACLFFYIGSLELDTNAVCWLTVAKMQDAATYDKYIISLYWAFTTMTTVGYGDVAPYTMNEKIYAIFSMLIACGVFAYVVGSIETIARRSNTMASVFQEKILHVNQFLMYKQIPKYLRLKVRRYLEYMFEYKKQYKLSEVEVLNMLNENLKDQVIVHLNGRMLKNTQIFSVFDFRFLSEVTFLLVNETYSMDDHIFEEGERGNKMYFITKGNVVILQKSSHTYIKELNVDEYFGEIAFFSDIHRQATARSRGFTEVLSLNKESFTDIAHQQQYRSAERTYYDIYDKLSFPPHDYNAIFVVCYLCGQQGHLSVHCPELFDSIKGNLQSHIQQMKDQLNREQNEKNDSENLDANAQKEDGYESSTEEIKTEEFINSQFTEENSDDENQTPQKAPKKQSIPNGYSAMTRALQKRPSNHIKQYKDIDDSSSNDEVITNAPPAIRFNKNVGAVTIETAQKFQMPDDPHQYHIDLSSSDDECKEEEEEEEEEKVPTSAKLQKQNTIHHNQEIKQVGKVHIQVEEVDENFSSRSSFKSSSEEQDIVPEGQDPSRASAQFGINDQQQQQQINTPINFYGEKTDHKSSNQVKQSPIIGPQTKTIRHHPTTKYQNSSTNIDFSNFSDIQQLQQHHLHHQQSEKSHSMLQKGRSKETQIQQKNVKALSIQVPQRGGKFQDKNQGNTAGTPLVKYKTQIGTTKHKESSFGKLYNHNGQESSQKDSGSQFRDSVATPTLGNHQQPHHAQTAKQEFTPKMFRQIGFQMREQLKQMGPDKFGISLYKDQNSQQRIPNSIYLQTKDINIDGKLLFDGMPQGHNLMNSNFMSHEGPGQPHHNHPHYTQQNFTNIQPYPKPKHEKHWSTSQEVNFMNHHQFSGNSPSLINPKKSGGDSHHHLGTGANSGTHAAGITQGILRKSLQNHQFNQEGQKHQFKDSSTPGPVVVPNNLGFGILRDMLDDSQSNEKSISSSSFEGFSEQTPQNQEIVQQNQKQSTFRPQAKNSKKKNTPVYEQRLILDEHPMPPKQKSFNLHHHQQQQQ